jgi:glycosyltransferase involved in cell wall biosynthesis
LNVRVAWFSPLPPSTSGIAAYSVDVLPLLQSRGLDIDVFTAANAHDFVWMRRRRPYDLTVFQLGNAQCHDYMWAYLFRYPGLVVLHDAQLHQARALFLTKRWAPRIDDYKAEVRASHPDAPLDLPYLVLARMGDRMYQHWPLIRLVVERARTTLVHNEWVAADLREKFPAATIRAIEMGVSEPRPQAPDARPQILARHDLARDAVVIAAFGGVTPEKRIPQLLRALAAVAPRHPDAHLMLVGATAEHYDVAADADANGITERVRVTGFVADDQLPAYLEAADICACLRWPTNRETSASWLRCLSAGKATIVTELAHLAAVPTLDPRGWRRLDTLTPHREPVAVSIDPLDEDHSLQLALERLITDRPLRERLGSAALQWWQAHHRLETMADGYMEVLAAAARAPIPEPALPAHLVNDGSTRLDELTRALAMDNPLPREERAP